MKEIQKDGNLKLQVLATGTHNSELFGNTYQELLADGFVIDEKIVNIGGEDSAIGVSTEIAHGLLESAKALEFLNPDLIVVLGDRFEIFATVTAALISRIPIAHIHGGELTTGAFDDALRHSITKMSQVHFVATNEYERRVIQLGEAPSTVFQVGGLGVDVISQSTLLTKNELEEELGLKFKKKNLLVTFHPETLGSTSSRAQIQELLSALSCLDETLLIFTKPNADPGGLAIDRLIEKFVANNQSAHYFKSMGIINYLSCIAFVDGVVGNSSSGLTEVPSFKKGTINIGDRQKGRIAAKSVINCAGNQESILNAFEILYSKQFQNQLSRTVNPYGNGGASKQIVDVIKEIPLAGIIKKSFHDL
jgi:GDP/UDP-N,N'-diacetylbacillosamine 2-epimerase (hydrolysing)